MVSTQRTILETYERPTAKPKTLFYARMRFLRVSLLLPTQGVNRRMSLPLSNRKCRYTQGKMTSHSLWSQYDRNFVGITRHNALSLMAKIYRVIQIKLNQLVLDASFTAHVTVGCNIETVLSLNTNSQHI